MLNTKQLDEIKQLQDECEALDCINLKLNWDMLENRNSEECNDFFHYEQGRLVGFLGLYHFGNKYELCGMVSPEWRRKGIYTKLFQQAVEMLKNRKDVQLLINAPGNSESAKAFLRKIGAEIKVSEYQMKWHDTKLNRDDTVIVRPPRPADYEIEISLDVQCFGFTEREAVEFAESIKQTGKEHCCVIEHDGKTVGKIRVDRGDGQSWIYGFAVSPDQQGKGIGRRALTNVVLQERESGVDVFLEVEAENEHALKLYQSCGFRKFYVQDYYRFQI